MINPIDRSEISDGREFISYLWGNCVLDLEALKDEHLKAIWFIIRTAEGRPSDFYYPSELNSVDSLKIFIDQSKKKGNK